MKDRINERNGNYEWFTEKCAAGSKEGNKEGRDDHRSRTDPDVDPVCDTSFHNAG